MTLGGWEFDRYSPNIDESILPDEIPADYVLRVALAKTNAVRDTLPQSVTADTVILAADTAVVAPSSIQRGSSGILGKPSSPDEAIEMLRMLRGKTHQVLTGLVVFRLHDQLLLKEVVSTAVEMRDYSEKELLEYVASGDPMDKAGAYAIQNQSFAPVRNLQGCYANVMGLPVCHMARLLAKFGYPAGTDLVRNCERSLDYRCIVYEQIYQG